MNCVECGSGMLERANFCPQCGTTATRACESCGHEHGAAARFCEQCGAPVGDAGLDRSSGETASADAVRKTVTVLFADLIGSTSFGERVDAESVRETLAGYHAMARRVIEDQDGVVAKFIGDGVMALFGVPETSEDDAVRAVTTGVALQSEFASIAVRVEQQFGVEIGLRVGINTGELVIGSDDDDLVGDAVNMAARIEAACRPGEVLVGESTWRLTRAAVEFAELGVVSAKGKADPIATYQVTARSRLDDDAPTPFVGREAELASIRSVFDDAVSGRVARLASVIGSPGVGKTRLAREFSSSVADSAGVVEMRCRRSGTATFAPIAEALRSTAGIADDDPLESITAAIRGLVGDLHDADRVAALLTSFLDDGAVRSTEEAFFAVRRLTEAMASQRPVVVLVDDIQWAEPLFLDLLEHLAEWVDDAAVLIVTSARPEIREVRPSFAAESRALRAVVQLDGLDADHTAELASRLVGSSPLPSELLDRLPTSTEGNPLFVRELMKTLVDDGVIVEVDGVWELTVDAEAVEVPPTIQSLLAARLDRLPPEERGLLELASVVGSEFPLGAVQAIAPTGTSNWANMRAAMDRLRRRELVEPTGRYWGDEAVYRFHHALIRDAAYRRMLKRRRADLHVVVGKWTERTAEGLPGEHQAAIGYHHECAYGYLRELSADEAETRPVGRTAARLFGVSAQRSLERDDVAAAGALAERAIACLDPGDPAVADLLLTGCEALLAVGEVARATELVRRLGEFGGDLRLRGWAACFDAQLAVMTEPERLEDVAQRLEATAGELAELGDRSGVAKARLVRAQALARMGRIGECESELDVALTAARAAGDRRRVAAVLGAAPVAALWGPSPIPRAGGRCLDVIRLLRITGGSPAVEATSTRCQAVLEALRGRFDTARSMLAEARTTVEEFGLSHGVLETEFYTGIVELLAGDPDAAEPRLRAAFEGLDRLGLGADAGHVAAYLARALLRLGRIDDADEFAQAAERAAGQNPQTGISAGAVRAEVAARSGNLDEAVELARVAFEMAAATDLVVDHADASAVLAMLAEAAGDGPTATRARRDAAALAEQKGAVPRPSEVDDTGSGSGTPARLLYPPGRDCVLVDRTMAGSGAEVELPASLDRRVLGTWQGRVSLVELRADGGLHRFAVEEFDPSGELTRVTLFAPTTTAIQEANNLADERFATTTDLAPSYDVILRFTNATQHRDADAFDEITEPTFVWVDHRDLGWPLLNRDEITDLYRDVTSPAQPFFAGDLVEVGVHGIVIRGAQLLVTANGELDEAMPACVVFVANDHRVERMEWFSETDTDRAIARFHELGDISPDDDDGPVIVDHVADAGGVEPAVLAAAHRRGVEVWHPTVAIIGIRDDERGVRRFAVEETDAAGTIVAIDLYPLTTEGLTEAERRFSTKISETSEHPVVGQLLTEFGVAVGNADLATLDRLLAPDFALFDHRALPFPAADRAQFLDPERVAADLPESVFIASGPPLANSDRGLVQPHIAIVVGPDGTFTEQLPACLVHVITEGRIERTEMFEEDDADRAVARFQELTADSQPPSSGPTNVSTRTADRFAEIFNERGDLRTLGFADGFVRIDRRDVVGAPNADAEEFVRASEAYFADDPVMEIEHLAIRGSDHSLHRAAITARGWEIERLIVGRVDPDGRLTRTVAFDSDSFDDAIAELDQQWFVSLNDAEQHVVQVGTRYGRAASTWNLPVFEEVTTEDFAYYDGTPLGARWLDRQQYLESQRLQGELFGPRHSQVFDVAELPRPDVMLSRVRSAGPGRRWEADWEREMIIVLQILGDQVHRLGSFAYDDLETACDWARNLNAPDVPGVDEPLDNLARKVGRRMVAAMNDGSLHDRGEEFFEPGWQRFDHRSIVGTGVIDESTHSDLILSLQSRAATRPVATRGELFSLSLGSTRYDQDYESRYLVMSEVSPAGRQVRVDMFDEDALDGALGELDRRWRAGLSERERQNLAALDEFGRTFDTDDTAALDRLLGPVFWFDDRQPLGAGVLDRPDFLDFHRLTAEVQGGSERQRHTIHFLTVDVVLVNTTVFGLIPETGVDWRKTIWLVADVSDGKVHHTAGFGGDERAAALEYATEIASEQRRDEARWNRAVRVADRLARRLRAGLGVTRKMVADDVRLSTVHAGGEVTEAGVEAFVSDPDGPYPSGAAVRFRPIARRGDDVMLAHEFDDAATDPTRLTVLRIDAHGRLVRVAHFEPAALDAARDELERSWWAMLSPTERATVLTARELGEAFQTQDRDAFRSVLAPDFVEFNHGQFGLGELDFEGSLASHEGRNDLFGASRQTYNVVDLPVPDVMVVRSTVDTSPEGTDWEVVIWNIIHVRDGQVLRLETYPENDPGDAVPQAWVHRRAQEIIDQRAV